jgi:hypothetical protein
MPTAYSDKELLMLGFSLLAEIQRLTDASASTEMER